MAITKKRKLEPLLFKIELKDFSPKIWRRIAVSADCTLADFAYVIIAAFNGDGHHLYNFCVNNKHYTYVDEDSSPIDNDAEDFLITDALKIGEQCELSYDFGDDWRFAIKFERILEGEGIIRPTIIDGAGYGIVEDCGGVQGLKELQDAFKTKTGEKYYDFREWLSVDNFDINAFDLAEQQQIVDNLVPSIKQGFEG